MAKKSTSKATLKSQCSTQAAPYGYTPSGRIRKIPLKAQRQDVPARTLPAKKKAKKPAPAEISTKSAADELDRTTYFKVWSIKQHLRYHHQTLMAQDETVLEDHQLGRISVLIEHAIKELHKVVPTAPTGDATSPGSPPQL